jgi:membrane-associated phospholipid phosphatase
MRQTFITIVLFLTLAGGSSLYAQDKYDFTQFGIETDSFMSKPYHWHGSDFLIIGAIGAGTFALSFIDKDVQDFCLKHQQYAFSAPFEFGRMWGDVYSTALFTTIFGLNGWVGKNETSKKIAFEVVQASLYSEMIVQLSKVIVGRERPFGDEGNVKFYPFTFLNNKYNSFPSGHTTNAVAISTVLARNTDNTWLKVLCYVPAVLTVSSRIYQNQHWTSDCLAGAAIGYFTGNWIVDQHDKKPGRVQITSIDPFVVSVTF